MEGQCVWQRNPDADVKYEQKELDRVVEEHKKYLDRARICCFSEWGGREHAAAMGILCKRCKRRHAGV